MSTSVTLSSFQFSSRAAAHSSARKALVLGLFKEKDQPPTYTKSTQQYLDKNSNFKSCVDGILGSKFDSGNTRLLYNEPGYDVLCLTHLGPKNEGNRTERKLCYMLGS